MKKLYSLACLVLLITVALPAQSLEQQIDEIMNEHFPADGPGATVIVVDDGQTIYHKGFGLANVELQVPMQKDHVFAIGSITKQFTAAAILKLQEEGKLNVKDDITKYISFPTQGNTVTIEHLLTHTSGIQSYTSMPEWTPEVHRQDMTVDELIDFFKEEDFTFKPGEEWLYNNSGYILLGKIIEEVSGMTYGDYIESTFFEPLGMTNSYYPDEQTIYPGRVSGYAPGPDGITKASYISMTQPYAAGSLLSSVGDLAKWYEALFAGQVLKLETLKLAHTPYLLNDGSSTNYGYGWMLGYLAEAPTIEHGGALPGYLSKDIYLPDQEIFVAVFSNCTCNSPDQPAAEIAALVGDVIPDYKPMLLNATELQEFVGVYENEEGIQRYISTENDTLYSQVSGSVKFPVYAFDDDKFFFEHGLTTLEFQRNEEGQITSVVSKGRNEPITWQRTEEEIIVREETEVPIEILQRYEGTYELVPGFDIRIFLEGDDLFGQATGQQAFKLWPESETKFFLKIVDAQVEFQKNNEGEWGLILYQGGQVLPGKRK